MTKPTNDERCEVAARLRGYIDFDFGDSNPYWYLMKAVYRDVAIHDDNELFDRLADLIEPERTCRIVETDDCDENGHVYGRSTRCSLYRKQLLKKLTQQATFQYCYRCRARVVKE